MPAATSHSSTAKNDRDSFQHITEGNQPVWLQCPHCSATCEGLPPEQYEPDAAPQEQDCDSCGRAYEVRVSVIVTTLCRKLDRNA